MKRHNLIVHDFVMLTVAERCPPQLIFEALAQVWEVACESKVRKSKGALFVSVLKRAGASGRRSGAAPVAVYALVDQDALSVFHSQDPGAR